LGFRCGHKATIPQAQRIVQQNAYNRQKNAVRSYMTTEKSKNNKSKPGVTWPYSRPVSAGLPRR
jgi:hypothetical protein